jgi:hypothetical protein
MRRKDPCRTEKICCKCGARVPYGHGRVTFKGTKGERFYCHECWERMYIDVDDRDLEKVAKEFQIEI